MHPGYPGQDPYGQQPPHDPSTPQYQDPYSQPPQPAQPYGQPQYQDPYAQPQYQDPYAQQPTSGQPYPPPAYPAAGYGAPAQGQQNTMGLVGMILGIVSIPMVCCLYLGIPLGVAAAVLGFLGKQKADQGLASNRGQAVAGLICGAIGAVLGIVLLILNVAFRAMDFTYTG